MRKNTLYNLDSISKYSIYSKLNVNFDKLLGDRSLKGFVKVNKRPKIVKKLNLLEEIRQKYPNEEKEIKEKKDPHEFLSELILKNSQTIKNNNINNNKYNKIFKSQPNNKSQMPIKNYLYPNKNKKKYQEIAILDPFKYNPNYDAIFKKVPYVKIIEPKETEKKEFKNNKQKKILTTVPTSIDNTHENENSKSNNSINDNNKEKENKEIKLPLVNNRIYTRNDNHTLRFSKYGNQKHFLYIKNENENEDYNKNNNYNSNSISVDKLNRKRIITVNFDKMMSRRENDFVNNYSLNNPSFNRYSPKYDFVKNAPAKISFSYHNEYDDITKKKFLLRKILASYQVDTEFQIVNNDKIMHNKSSNFIDS